MVVILGVAGAIFLHPDIRDLRGIGVQRKLPWQCISDDDHSPSVIFYSAKKKILITLDYDPEATGITDKTTFEDADDE